MAPVERIIAFESSQLSQNGEVPDPHKCLLGPCGYYLSLTSDPPSSKRNITIRFNKYAAVAALVVLCSAFNPPGQRRGTRDRCCGQDRRHPMVSGGCFLSLILLQIISTGFNLLGFSPYLTEAIWGATMILALAIALVRDR